MFVHFQTKTLKTAVIAPLHTGHSDTALMQLAHRQRWPHGTTAYSALSSKQMAHSVVTGLVEAGLGGSGSGGSGSSAQHLAATGRLPGDVRLRPTSLARFELSAE